MELENKIIVLTGPSSGVGLELLRLLGPNNIVVGLSRNHPPADAIDAARDYTHVELDLADGQAVGDTIAPITAKHPDGIDGLINCAAVQFTPRFLDADFDPGSVEREIAINLTSPIRLIAGLIDALGKASEPFVMNINSGLGLVPKTESAVYCATKAGLDNFTRGLRAQLTGTRIAVQQTILPLVDTPMTDGRGSGKLQAADVAAQIVRAIEKRTPDTDIGKVGLLRRINRLSPALAHRIMARVG